ncbi:MAG: efflux RND transporter permease subunit, partial [Chloroflexota bacterium]|nr:efflux RND transporter permease subunit [Chloroflexota bacterium]
MMRAIVEWSLRFRLLVLGLGAAMLVFGFVQLPNVPVDVVPDFTPPFVEVQTEALGLSAEEVEQLITVPLEADLLNGVAWLDSIQSESVAGLSSIVLVFEPGTDVIRARQMVAERLTQAHALPNVSKAPIMLQPLSSTSRVMMVGLSSDELSLIDMSVLARWTIRPRLMGVAGVANVAVWGQRERQLQVQVDPERLQAAGISLKEVVETTGNALWFSPLTFLSASTPGTGGFIDTPNQRLSVQHISPITTAEELSRVPIEPDDPVAPGGQGTGLTLGDVATVVEDHQPLIGDAIVNDGPGLLLVIEKFPDANALEVTRGIDEALDALRPGLSGIEIDPTIFRPATFIETALGNLAFGLLIAFALMAVTLGTLLFSWRALVICLVAIPLSLAAGGLVLYLMGATINAIVVAGFALAVGVIVDDSVIGIDSIVRRLRVPRPEDQGKPLASIILEATVEGRSAIAYATLIILLAILPVVFIGGAAGAFLPPLVLAFALAVLTSTLVALSVSVALGMLLLPRESIARREPPFLRWLQRHHQAALSRLISRPRPTFLAAGAATIGVVVLAAIGLTPQLGQSVLPTFKDRDLLVHWDAPPGASRTEMNRVVTLASQELRAIPGVRNVGAHIGRAITSDQVVSINSGELWISIDPAADYGSTLASIKEVVAGYPSGGREISTYVGERISQVLAGPQHDIVVRVYG